MPIPLGSCEIWFAYQLSGDAETMYTHLAYLQFSEPTQAAVDAGFTQWQTSWRSLAPPSWNLVGGHVLDGRTGGTARFDSSITPVPGTATASNVPQNVAYLIKKTTGEAGRRARGRMFIPGVGIGALAAGGIVTTAGVTALNAAAATLMPGGAVHTAFGFLSDPVVLHETGSQTPTIITDLTASNLVATQRRRLRR